MSVCIDQHQQHTHSQCLAPYATNNNDWIERARKTINIWLYRKMQRKELRRLDDHMLRDIGITREQAEREFTKPFWK